MTIDMNMPLRLVVIAGPTGVGKSELALDLAELTGGEIVSADSMQVYRHMDIGTAKPDRQTRIRINHHMIDIVDPDEEFNAALFAREADTVIHDIARRGCHIIIAGGTGLYVRALLRGLFDAPPCNRQLRSSYRLEAEKQGDDYLYYELNRRDGAAARHIHPHDRMRIIRALEILDITGEMMSEKRQQHLFAEKRYDCLFIGLAMERPLLYERINRRVDAMIEEGLVEEVEELLSRGYDETLKPMQSMCYKSAIDYLKGKMTRDDAVSLIKRDTRRYAKRQITWFGNEEGIVWMPPHDRTAIYNAVKGYLNL